MRVATYLMSACLTLPGTMALAQQTTTTTIAPPTFRTTRHTRGHAAPS